MNTPPTDPARPATPAAAASTGTDPPVAPAPSVPRWMVVLAWSIGPAAAYALLGLLHAALVERALSVDIGFGRSLAFWVAAIYLALLLWGFLPSRVGGWYARRSAVRAALVLGVVGALVCAGFTVAWLVRHWNATTVLPVLASTAALGVVAVVALRIAGRAGEEPEARSQKPGGESKSS